MIKLKQIIHDAITNSVEATWVDRTIAPDTVVPEELLPDTTDDEGNITLGKVIPAHIVPGAVTEVQVKCHSYSDRQMQLLRDHAAIAGTPLTDYEALIALVESNIQPIPPPTAEQVAEEARQVALEDAKTAAKADNVVRYLRDHTPAEVEAYVQTNVTDLASARQMMKKFAVVLCVLSKQNFR